MVSALVAKYEERERAIVRALFLAAVALLLLYGYFLISSIIDALLRQEYAQAAARTGSSIGAIESKYMKAEAAVDDADIASLGFVDAPSPSFISRDPSIGTSLTFNR